jgi:DNA/RNA-binding domain of Phe-tRNA-synthetase-like protein
VGLQVDIDAGLRGRVRIGLAVVEAVSVREADPTLSEEIDGTAGELRRRHAGRAPSEVEGVAEARALYRSLGLDPTRTRPSNEALLRRVLRGEPLYRVNTLVDAVNLVSLRRQLPFGLYDLARLEPPIELRLGAPGESYPGIRKGEIRVAGRPALADARGPFGNPSADSERTSIRLDTSRALVVAWGPGRLVPQALADAIAEVARMVERHCGGSAVERRVLPAHDAPEGWA